MVEPDDGLIAIGSGGAFAQSAAKALVRNTKMQPKEIVKEAEKPSDGLKKVQSSLMHLVPSDFSDNNFYNSKINSQVKDKCSCCYSKLSPSQKQYFAFDKEYCYKCWNKINLNY